MDDSHVKSKFRAPDSYLVGTGALGKKVPIKRYTFSVKYPRHKPRKYQSLPHL